MTTEIVNGMQEETMKGLEKIRMRCRRPNKNKLDARVEFYSLVLIEKGPEVTAQLGEVICMSAICMLERIS